MCVCVQRQGRHTQKDTSEKLCDGDYSIEKAKTTRQPAQLRIGHRAAQIFQARVQFSCLLSVNLEPEHATCRKAKNKVEKNKLRVRN